MGDERVNSETSEFTVHVPGVECLGAAVNIIKAGQQKGPDPQGLKYGPPPEK